MHQTAYGEGSTSDEDESDYEGDEEEEEEDDMQEKITDKKNNDFVPNKKLKIAELDEPPILPKNLDQLIELSKICGKNKYRDVGNLSEALPYLIELQSLIGLNTVKQQITDHILIKLQNTYISLPHVKIYGQPGCGKTSVLILLAKIYKVIGCSETTNVVLAQMTTDFISDVLGKTAKLTRKTFEKARGGFLVIDEIHNISDNRHQFSSDSYSKSCADTMNEYLTKYSKLVTVFIAGYEEAIERDFFSLNKGLKSRFPTTFRFEPYTTHELKLICYKMIQDRHYTTTFDIPLYWFENKTIFGFQGRSVSTFIDKIMHVHSRNTFGKLEKTIILQEEIEEAYNSL